MANPTIQAAIQDVLTRGLDVARAVVADRLRINDPAAQVTGPQGTVATVGQPAGGTGIAASVGSIPQWAWIAGAAGLALVIVLALRK